MITDWIRLALRQVRVLNLEMPESEVHERGRASLRYVIDWACVLYMLSVKVNGPA